MKRIVWIVVCIGVVTAVLGYIATNMTVMPAAPSEQESIWTGRSGVLTAWGHGNNTIFGILGGKDAEPSMLTLWRWDRSRMKEAIYSPMPGSRGFVPCDGGLCGVLRYIKSEKGRPYALVNMKSGEVLKQWDIERGWYLLCAGGSANGKYIATIRSNDRSAEDIKTGTDRSYLELIDVQMRDRRLAASLEGHGHGTVRRICVTDDGRYVAVVGWENGTLMVDAREEKVMWAKRPPGEISSGYGAFSPDGKQIYTAGSEGCVYTIDVETGNVLTQRWATPTGRTIYGYRVSAIAVSPDGKWLGAGTGPEGDVYLWNLGEEGPARRLLHGHGSIMIVAFSPDSKMAVTVGGGYLRTWRLPQ